MKRPVWLLIPLVALTVCGCNSGSTPNSSAGAAGDAETSAAADDAVALTPMSVDEARQATEGIKPSAGPDAIVVEFLQAIKSGDPTLTAGLLTQQAREETAKHGLEVATPGTPAAKYVVGDVRLSGANKDLAKVDSHWTDEDEMGNVRTYEIVWKLRKQVEGWRVAGMETDLGEGQSIEFNFEDVAAMLQMWDSADSAMAGDEQPADALEANAGSEADAGVENSLR